MPFQKGQPKIGGRKKGTPNKKTRLLEIAIQNNKVTPGFNPLDEILKLMKKPEVWVKTDSGSIQLKEGITDMKKVDVLIELLEFVYPKRTRVDIAADESLGNTLVDVIKGLEAKDDSIEVGSYKLSEDDA